MSDPLSAPLLKATPLVYRCSKLYPPLQLHHSRIGISQIKYPPEGLDSLGMVDAGIQKASTASIFLLEVCLRLGSEIVSLLKPTAYNAFIDFCLALLPLSIVWNMNLNKRRKFALSILLSLGILYVIYKYLQVKTRP